MPKYYTLAEKRDGRWTQQFGDYDKEVVVEELEDYRMCDDASDAPIGRVGFRIVTTPTDDQPAIENALARLNGDEMSARPVASPPAPYFSTGAHAPCLDAGIRKMTLDVWSLREAFPSQSVPAQFEGFCIAGVSPCCGLLIPLSWTPEQVEKDGLTIGCPFGCEHVELAVRVPPRRTIRVKAKS